ncbi:MAG TPA: sulfotransferase domain-containing protein [Rhizomicrobium sp.]|jgi:hypothetical protein
MALCAGLKSSGSTWLYNAVIQILEAGRARSGKRRSLAAFYAEDLRMFPANAEFAGQLAVKTHIPSASLQFLARFVRAKIFITVREPRDAIASLMQRFDHEFANCLAEVAAGAERIIELSKAPNVLILRYEDGFYDRPEGVSQVAAHLGARISAATRDRIFRSLTREEVKRKIDALERKGVFGRSPDPDRFDPKTHWHPGHVGDGTIGKFETVLSAKQRSAVLAALQDYCRTFGYPNRDRAKSIRKVPGRRG